VGDAKHHADAIGHHLLCGLQRGTTMSLPETEPRHIRAALFVDFDNIQIGLEQQDPSFAAEFATNPERWLTWLEKQMPCNYPGVGPAQRRILIRRCYMNPHKFSGFRPYFIRSAFEVIDCPPLTARGKTSTDIHMVMDILDSLHESTYLHEFIILSGDADFTPVLLRLRRHDRCNAVLSVGYVSPAYKASCDYLISQDEFVHDALGIRYQEDEGPQIHLDEISEATAGILDRMAARIWEVAAPSEGIEASELPAVYKEFAEFRQSIHWLGFYSLRRLTEALVARRSDLRIVEEDPWRVARAVPAQAAAEPGATEEAAADLLPADPRAELSAWLKTTVSAAKAPVTMAQLAQAMVQHFQERVSNDDWLGAGTFKSLLEQLDLQGLKLSPVTPGYVYDPARHAAPNGTAAMNGAAHEEARPDQAPIVAPQDALAAKYPELAPLAWKVHQLTDTPYLLPEHYAVLLRELAREINERGYQLTRTSKTVRDRCVERGAPVARSHINFVLVGLGYMGYRFGNEPPERPERLGEALVQNTINLCRTAQLSLTEEEEDQVREWIMGKLATNGRAEPLNGPAVKH